MPFRRRQVRRSRTLIVVVLIALLQGCDAFAPSPDHPASPVPTTDISSSPALPSRIVVGVHVGDDAIGPLAGFGASDMPLFPMLANGHFMDKAVRRFVYSGVYRYDEEAAPVPDLAAEPCTASQDLRDITCQLHEATFHDGTPLMADDVAFIFQLRASEACRLEEESCVANLESAEADGARTVIFHLTRPDPTFLTVALADVLIESRQVIETSYQAFVAGSRDANPAHLAEVAARFTAALGGESPDCEGMLADAEVEVRALGLEPWSREEFNLGPNDRFNACGYLEYLARVLTDAHESLTSTGIDAIAAAYRILDYQDDVPIGSGPWRVRSVEPGKQMELEAHQAFHGGPPATFAVEVRLLRTKAEAISAVRDRSVDWLLQPFAPLAPSFLRDGLDGREDGLTFAEYNDPSWYALDYNLRPGAMFADKRLRMAMELCIDKEETVATATGGRATSIQSPVVPSSWGFNEDLRPPARDVAKARQLIEEAGWKTAGPDDIYTKDGRPLSAEVVVRARRPDRLAFIQLVAAQVRDCGIEIVPRELEDELADAFHWPHLLPGTQRQWDLAFNGLISTGSPDPGLDYPVFHSSDISTAENENGSNMMGYKNPEVDALLDEAMETYDLRERARLYREYQRILTEDPPMLFAWALRLVEVRSDRLTSVDGPLSKSSATWWWELEKLVLDEAAT